MRRLVCLGTALCLLLLCACGGSAQGSPAPTEPSASAAPLTNTSSSGDTGFSDVPAGAWYAEAVTWCRENGVMSGTSANQFRPEEPLSRAMTATILWKQSGSPSAAAETAFEDVLPGAWYETAVCWAAAQGLMAGYGHNRFGPDDPVTREQLAAVLWKFAGSPDTVDAPDFADANDISPWAKDAARWARSAGILTGKDGNRFDPQSHTTRAEAAVMMYHFFHREAASDTPVASTLPYDNVYPQHDPYGTGVGAMPGRVVWSYEPDSVDWDGSGYWWELDHFDEPLICQMVNDSIAALAGEDSAQAGWNTLFTAHNAAKGRTGGYQPGERIAIKANINGSAVYDDNTSGETAMSYTNPVLLKALLLSLVQEAGVSPADITVYDVSRLFPDYMVELCTEGVLKGVHFVNRDNGVADENAPIVWSHEFSGRVNYLPTCVTETTYLINLANLKGHSYGITLCGKNHFGSFLNGNAMRPPEGANLHQWLTRNEMGIYSPLVDLMANADLGGKTVLYMLDALICAPSEGASITAENAKWEQAPFNGDYTSSLFVSQDPVAIDSVGADFLMNEPAVTKRNGALRDDPTVENYLHEAGLVSHAPSGTVYTDSNGHTVTNLGVHEHWNNSTEKLYSRNLGEDEGIELIRIGAQ